MTIVTRQWLIDNRNLTMAFIREHDQKMGGRGKPRRYDLALVDAYLFVYFREKLSANERAVEEAARISNEIDSLIAGRGNVLPFRSEMTGGGGRVTA